MLGVNSCLSGFRVTMTFPLKAISLGYLFTTLLPIRMLLRARLMLVIAPLCAKAPLLFRNTSFPTPCWNAVTSRVFSCDTALSRSRGLRWCYR